MMLSPEIALFDPSLNLSPWRGETLERGTPSPLRGGQGGVQTGKELDDETGYSYFGARYYDPNISIWLSVDPLSDKYPNLSSYTYTANNPIRLIDPNGESWKTTDDEKTANRMSTLFHGREIYYSSQASKYESKASKLAESGKNRRAARFEAKADEMRAGQSEMNSAQGELKSLGLSQTEFTFKKSGDPKKGKTYMDANGTVVMESVNSSNMAHELKHGYQHLTGEIQLVPGGKGGKYADIGDEINAFTRQYFFDNYSLNSVFPEGSVLNSSYINAALIRSINRGKDYGSLPNGPINSPSYPRSVPKYPERSTLNKGI